MLLIGSAILQPPQELRPGDAVHPDRCALCDRLEQGRERNLARQTDAFVLAPREPPVHPKHEPRVGQRLTGGIPYVSCWCEAVELRMTDGRDHHHAGPQQRLQAVSKRGICIHVGVIEPDDRGAELCEGEPNRLAEHARPWCDKPVLRKQLGSRVAGRA